MNLITVQANINASLQKVWQYWTEAIHVQHWNFASSDWHCPNATNNLVVGGEFHYTMAAKDNSMSFDFWGTYKVIDLESKLEILLGDGRQMIVSFSSSESYVFVTESFEPEQQNPVEMQQAGWQMILDNFKRYVEG